MTEDQIRNKIDTLKHEFVELKQEEADYETTKENNLGEDGQGQRKLIDENLKGIREAQAMQELEKNIEDIEYEGDGTISPLPSSACIANPRPN